MGKVRFQSQVDFLSLIGLHTVRSDSPSRRRLSLLHCLAILSVLGLGLSFVVSSFFEVRAITDDVSWKVVLMMMHVMGATKVLILVGHRDGLRWVYAVLSDELNVETPNSKRSDRLFVLFLEFCLLCVLVNFTYPLVLGYERMLPMSFRVPFRTDTGPSFLGAYVLTSCIIGTAGLCHMVSDATVVNIASRTYNRFAALGNEFRNLGDHHHLKSCIIEHNQILRVTRFLSDITSVTYFFQVFASAAQVCMSVYLIIRTKNWMQSVSQAAVLAPVLSQLLLYCFVGQQLTNASEELHFECYNNAWYNCTLQTRKSLVIVLNVTSKTIVLKGCYIVDMSYRMFLQVITEAYSYLMILLSLT